MYRDKLLDGAANNGVRFIGDLGFPYSYPGGALTGRPAAGAPANGAQVVDVSGNVNGQATILSGQTVGYAGGGFDFSTLTATNSFLQVPASVAADLWTPYGGASQRYLICAYVKLPSSVDWNAEANAAPFISFATNNASAGNPDIVTVAQMQGGQLLALRQTGGSNLVFTSFAVPAGAFGQVAQLAFWRNSSGIGLTLKAAGVRTTLTGAVGADNTENFTGQAGRFGVGNAYWLAGFTGSHANAKKFRLYRNFVENLARSGRDPLTVLDADYARVIARAAFA